MGFGKKVCWNQKDTKRAQHVVGLVEIYSIKTANLIKPRAFVIYPGQPVKLSSVVDVGQKIFTMYMLF